MKIVQGLLTAFGAIIPLCLTGCVSEQDIRDDLAVQEDYQRYLELQKSGALDSEGCYSTASEEEADIPGSGDILISFADNSFLDMRYKLSDGTFVTDKCCLSVGDTLYVEAPQRKETTVSTYQFDRLEIKANDGYDVNFEFENAENGAFKLTIPESYRGKSLTVLPKGKFEDRSVVCKAVVIGENGETTTAGGRWGLSDDTYCKTEETSEATTLTFSGTAGYTVKYDFDGNYFYVDETSDDGATVRYNSVSFPSMKPSDKTPEYTIKLRKFVTVEFDTPAYIDSITVNGNKAELTDGKLTKLRRKDNVVVKLKKGAVIDSPEYADTPREHSDGCKEYTLKLPDKEKAELKVTWGSGAASEKLDFDGVNISYTDKDGKLIAFENLVDNEKYDITITAKDNYKLVDDGFHFLNIGKVVDKNGVANLNNIPKEKCHEKIAEVLENCLKKQFAVYLSEADEMGEFEYKLDGKKFTVKGMEPVAVYAGQKLKVTYTAHDGYKIQGSIGKTKNVTVEIPEDWEGKTLVLGDFGIEVKTE